MDSKITRYPSADSVSKYSFPLLFIYLPCKFSTAIQRLWILFARQIWLAATEIKNQTKLIPIEIKAKHSPLPRPPIRRRRITSHKLHFHFPLCLRWTIWCRRRQVEYWFALKYAYGMNDDNGDDHKHDTLSGYGSSYALLSGYRNHRCMFQDFLLAISKYGWMIHSLPFPLWALVCSINL